MMNDLLTVFLGVLALVVFFAVVILVALGTEALKCHCDPDVKAARQRRRDWDRVARRD